MFIHEHQSEFSRFSDYLFNYTPRTIAAFLANTYIRSSTLLIYIPSLSCLRRHNVKITILYNLKINYRFSFIVLGLWADALHGSTRLTFFNFFIVHCC